MSNIKRRTILVTVAGAFALTIATAIPASAGQTPTEYFTAVQTSINAPQTVVAAGPISATGTDVQLGRHRDRFVFPDGTVTVRHEPTTHRQTFDVRTCVGTQSETGTYSIANGSGAYARATGSGNYKVSIVFQGCDQTQPPTSFSIVIEAHGPLSLN